MTFFTLLSSPISLYNKAHGNHRYSPSIQLRVPVFSKQRTRNNNEECGIGLLSSIITTFVSGAVESFRIIN